MITEQPNNDPQLLFVPPGSLNAVLGSKLLRKKTGLSDRDRESLYLVEECSVEEIKHTHKYIALFFSASWCPPCQTFVRLLKEFYAEVNIESKLCEVVYVSLDKRESDY